jgi:hypothetical protein
MMISSDKVADTLHCGSYRLEVGSAHHADVIYRSAMT